MDTQTLGAAIAISKKQTEEAIEGIAGELQGVLVSVVDHGIVLTQSEEAN